MSNLFIILKYNLFQYFNKLKKVINKKNKKSNIAIGLTFGLICILLYAVIIYYLLLFAIIFAETGKSDGVLMIVVVMMSMISFTTTLTKANSLLFRMQDFEQLAVLPIRNKDILISKFISLIGFNPIISLLIGIPANIIYCMFNQEGVVFWPLSILIYLVIPVIPIVLGCFVSFLFGFIPLKQKVKNIFSTLLYIAFLLLIMIFSFSLSLDDGNMNNRITNMYDSLKNLYFLAPTVVLAILGNVSSGLIFVGLSVILLVAFIMIVSISFNKIISKINISDKSKKYKYNEKKYQELGVTKSLLKKEFIFYLSVPNYIINTLVGPMISIIITVILSLQIRNFGTINLDGLMISSDFFAIAFIAVYLFSFGLTSTTSSTISLEGKSFWILKSSPVSYKDVVLSKIMLNIVVNVPFLIIDIIILMILSSIGIINGILVFLAVLAFIVFNSIFGLYLNIKKHDFDIEPIKAIKNGLPVLFNMLSTLLLMFSEILICSFIYLITGIVITLLIIILFNSLLAFLSILLLNKSGYNSYKNIEH